MAELILEPYAAHLSWRHPEDRTLEEWQALFADLLAGLAEACAADEARVIGHVKGLGVLPDGSFLNGSTVTPNRPPDVEIHRANGGRSAEMELTLNVLVYGLPRPEAQRLVSEVSERLAAREGIDLDISPARTAAAAHTHT